MLDQVAPDLDAKPVAGGVVGEVDQPRAGRGLEVHRTALEAELDEPDRAVARVARLRGACDAVDALGLGQQPVDPILRLASAGGRLPDDVDGLAGAAGEVLLEQVGRGFALAPRRAELAAVLPRELRDDDERGREDRDPRDDDAPAAPVGQVCKTFETGCGL